LDLRIDNNASSGQRKQPMIEAVRMSFRSLGFSLLKDTTERSIFYFPLPAMEPPVQPCIRQAVKTYPNRISWLTIMEVWNNIQWSDDPYPFRITAVRSGSFSISTTTRTIRTTQIRLESVSDRDGAKEEGLLSPGQASEGRLISSVASS
jgi:hypothetical protein